MAHKWSDRTTYQGHAINYGTYYLLIAFNFLITLKIFGGETAKATMLQGGYNKGGVAASAGTHDGGGAFDLTPFNWKWRVWVLRLLGCAAWYRPYNWDNRGGGAHVHVEVCGDGTASAGAKAQWSAFWKKLNGLANRAKDPNDRPQGLPIFYHMPDGSDLAVHYATKTTVLRSAPSSLASIKGTINKGAKFTPVAVVKNGSMNYWVINTTGVWMFLGNLTTKKPVNSPIEPPVVVPTPPVPPVPVPSEKLTLNVGTINVIRWRLGKTNVRNYEDFKKGEDYSVRVKGLASIRDKMGVSVFGTEESGQYADADLLTKTMGEDEWTNVLHGDDAGDITEAVHVHHKRKMLASGKIITGDGRALAYHNTATYGLLQDTLGSDVIFLFVDTHSDYRAHGTASASTYDKNRETSTKTLITEAKKITRAAEEKYNVHHIPIVFAGDWNQDKDDVYDGPGKAMRAAGYVDAETVCSSKVGPETTINGLTSTKTTGRRVDRIFVEDGTEVGEMTTVSGYPNTDHNGVGVEITLSNK